MGEWIRNRRKTDGYPSVLVGKKIEARHRDGEVFIGIVGDHRWMREDFFNTSDGNDGDIIAYRIIEQPESTAKDPATIAPKLWNAYKDKLNDEALDALREVICGEHPANLKFNDYQSIVHSFSWEETKQGDDFWNNVFLGEYDKQQNSTEIEPHIYTETNMNESTENHADMVNNPPHYKQGDIECIDAIKSALTADEFRGYCKGNALKYIWREKHKGQNESVEKAIWYLNKLLEE